MFISKILSRTIPVLTRIAIENNALFHRKLLFTNFPLSIKCYSPDSSPIKNVSKKKRKISSSSEESPEEPAAKKVEKSPVKKKSSPEKKTLIKKSPATSAKKSPPKLKSPTTANKKNESPENKPLNGQEVEIKKEEVKEEITTETSANVLKIQSANAKGSDYNPGIKNYHPIKDAFWKKGEKYEIKQ